MAAEFFDFQFQFSEDSRLWEWEVEVVMSCRTGREGARALFERRVHK